MRDMDNDYRPHMLPKVRSDNMRSSAEGKPCSFRICSFYPGYQCWGDTVLCHPEIWGKGVNTKVTDLGGGYGCQGCHDIIDMRDLKRWKYITEKYPAAVMHRLLCGVTESHALMLAEGIIIVPDGEIIT